jgi:endoglucanase
MAESHTSGSPISTAWTPAEGPRPSYRAAVPRNRLTTRLLAGLTVALTVAVAPVWTGAASAAPGAASGYTWHDPRPYGRFGRPLALDQHNTAIQQLQAAGTTMSPAVRSAVQQIAKRPSANWIGSQSPAEAQDLVSRLMASAASQGGLAQLVMFNLPNRTCDRDDHFAVTTATSYRAWVRGFVRGLGKQRAIVVVEPDAVAMASCLPAAQQRERYALVKYAVNQVRAQGSWAYIDIGHSNWLSVKTAVSRLKASGISRASGFSLNVSNFRPNKELLKYGTAINRKVHRNFVIDTSRNGKAPTSSQWCNPKNTGLGHAPSPRTGIKHLDAYLWIKNPGGSDGACNGGPEPGHWYQQYALMLVRNARLK